MLAFHDFKVVNVAPLPSYFKWKMIALSPSLEALYNNFPFIFPFFDLSFSSINLMSKSLSSLFFKIILSLKWISFSFSIFIFFAFLYFFQELLLFLLNFGFFLIKSSIILYKFWIIASALSFLGINSNV